MAERLAKELSDNDRILEDEEVRETTFFRLESLGYRVGQGLVERYVPGVCLMRPRSYKEGGADTVMG